MNAPVSHGHAASAYLGEEHELLRAQIRRFVDEEIKFQWPDGDVETVHHEGFVMRTKALNGWPVCIALTGEVGAKVSCSVYDFRPTPCRTFEAGSAACLHVRKWAGIDLEKIA